MRYDSNVNTQLDAFRWVYPHTLEEYKLFNMLFDNRDFMREVFKKNRMLFDIGRPVIGFTVRRQFMAYGWRTFTERSYV